VAWQTAPDYRIFMGELGPSHGVHLMGLFGAPTGLDRIASDFSIVLRDQILNEAPDIGGLVQRAWDLRVGQYGYGVGVRLDSWHETRWLWGGTEAADPRIAGTMDAGTFAITAWGGLGVRLAILGRHELSSLPRVPSGDTPPPPPVDPPIPPPDPEPDPGVQTMMLPADVHATFVAVVEKYPHTGGDDDRRAAMEKAVQTIRARHGQRYVWKTEHANLTAPSKDALGCVPESEGEIRHGKRMKVFIWDMINGSTREPQEAHESEPLRSAYVLTPEPKDWLTGAEPQPEPEPSQPDPVPSQDIALLKRELAELRGRFDALANNVVRYGARLAIRTDNGHVFCAEGGGGGEVNATRRDAQGWETFKLEKKG
jgi:hypothetical protein